MYLSKDQKKAINSLITWFASDNRSPYITLGGYAGTGKTTIASQLRKVVHEEINPKLRVAFCSYTGRAVQVLKNILEETGASYYKDTISTIHGLIYSPVENENQEIIGWQKKEEVKADLIIVDEASMVDYFIWSDLRSYNIPIIAVGDHGQLPPIKSKFNLMENPDIVLKNIHRQATSNPIIHVSIFARMDGFIPANNYSDYVIKYSSDNYDVNEIIESLLESYTDDMIILCGYNRTRKKINNYIRSNLGFTDPSPQSGDRVICLRNNHEKSIYNGMLGTILTNYMVEENFYETEIRMDNSDKIYKGRTYAPQFNALEPINFTEDRRKIGKADLFDYGYALTVHKSQGSQARKVILFEERFSHMDDEMWKKWLYTGVTRAVEELYIFGA